MHVAQPGDHIMSLLEINNHIPDKTIHSIWKSQDETFHPSLPPDETTCGNITILSATAPLVTSMMLKLRWAFFRNHHHSHHYQHRYHHRYYYDHWSLIKQVENAKCAQFRALEQKRKNAEVESSHYITLHILENDRQASQTERNFSLKRNREEIDCLKQMYRSWSGWWWGGERYLWCILLITIC